MNNAKISNLQIKALIVTTVIGGGILSLPSDMARILDTGGWLGILIGGFATIPFLVMADKIFKKYPGKDCLQIGEELIGPLIFKFFLIVCLLYNITILAFVSRVFAGVIKAYLLETTPIWVIIITMLFAVSYLARSQIKDIARMAVVIYPIIIGFVIFLIAVNLPDMDYTNIYPIFHIEYSKVLKGTLTGFFVYSGFELIILAFPFAEDTEKTLQHSLRGIFLIMGIYLIIFFITLSKYGIGQLKREIWPTIAVIKEVDLPGYFLENLDGVAMAMWVMVVFGTMGPFLHASGIILAGLFKTKVHKIFIIPLIPIIYIIATLPKNLVQTYEIIGSVVNYFLIAVIGIIPTIVFIVAYIKGRRKKI